MEVALLPEDLTPEEKNSLQNYISNGCPGLVKIDDAKVFQWLELYMAGKGYAEIANITKERKDLIMYIAHKAKWSEKRLQYYGDMASGLNKKISNVKLQSADTVANAIVAIGKYYNDTFNKFLTTNDKSIIENMDTKVLSQYYKSLEILDKLISPSSKDDDDGGKKPTVNINLGSSGAVVTQVDDKTVDISTKATPDDEVAAGDLLKALAKYQRSKELKK